AGESAGFVTTLSGRADVMRPTNPSITPLKVQDDVYRGDKISTAAQSMARIQLSQSALVTVRELSVLTLTDDPGRVQVNIGKGAMALAAARQLMRPGESLEIRTPNAVAAIRGTVVIAEAPAASTTRHFCALHSTECFHVLKGAIEVRANSDEPSRVVRVNTSEGVSIINGKIGAVARMPDAVIAELRTLFQVDGEGEQIPTAGP
ncbi:MAG: FecR domain-containing protein, partial [Nitrospiraceae bacterium]